MTFILGLLAYIPGLMSLVTTVTNKWFDTKVQMYQTRWNTTRDVAVEAIRADAAIQSAKVNWIVALAQNPVMMMIVVGYSLPWIILEWKVIVYDNVWAHWGTYMTDPVRGNLGDWGGMIISGIFITSGGLGIAHAWFNKKD